MIGIGELIRVNRVSLGYNQEDLCFGICSLGNLSKIENGMQTPSRGTFDALMERMGLSSGVYPSFLSTSDKIAYELQHDFNEQFANEKYKEAEKTLTKLEKIPRLEKVYLQFIQSAKLLLNQKKNKITPDEAVKELENIISSFIKDFTVEKIRRSVLTKTEINILNAYAIALHRMNNPDKAIEILKELTVYIGSKVYDMENITIVYTKVLSNLAKYVGMAGDDEEAVRLCDIGINLCKRYNRFTYFASLLYYKCFGLNNIGGRDEEVRKCIRECYYINSALGESRATQLESVKRFAQKIGLEL